jgi:hypothetical protein
VVSPGSFEDMMALRGNNITLRKMATNVQNSMAMETRGQKADK